MRADVSERRLRRAGHGAMALLRYYPHGLGALLISVLRSLAGRAPTVRGLRPVASPSSGRVSFGSLRRTTPISEVFGFDRGQPIDRYYIESFLSSYAEDVQGRVLEFG